MRQRLAIVVALMIAGCNADERELAMGAASARPAVDEPAAPRVVLGAEAQTLYQRSLIRDPAPSCTELTQGLAAPVAALLEVAERVVAPPSSAMRAATCLLREHPAEIEPQLQRWVAERKTMGLGLLALNHLHELEPALAERLVGRALTGDYADEARRRIERSLARLEPIVPRSKRR